MGMSTSSNHNKMNTACSHKEHPDIPSSIPVYSEDPMEILGDSFPIGMSYTPWQQWKDIYPSNIALQEGTIFMELNKEFMGVRC